MVAKARDFCPKSIEVLLAEHVIERSRGIFLIEPGTITEMVFKGVPDDHRTYNCSETFNHGGRQYVFNRVEHEGPNSETSSVKLFRKDDVGGQWDLVPDFELKKSQDPSISYVDGRMILTAVRYPITVLGAKNNGVRTDFFDVLFRDGNEVPILHKFAETPLGHKNVHPIQCGDLGPGIYWRPQKVDGIPGSEVFGRGMVSFRFLDDIHDVSGLTESDYFNPNFLVNGPEGLFDGEEWGAYNGAQFIKGLGFVFAPGHIARLNSSYRTADGKPHKEYYPTVSLHDPTTNRVAGPIIIARREDFPEGRPPKRPELKSVVYMAGANLVLDADFRRSGQYMHFGLSDSSIVDAKLNTRALYDALGKLVTQLAKRI